MSEELNEAQPVKKKCTLLFNVVLTLLWLYYAITSYEYIWRYKNEPPKHSDFPWQSLPWSNNFHYSEQVFAICNIFILLFLGPWIIKLIWNRLIANLFPIRCITYAEAYTAFIFLTAIKMF